MSRGGMCLLAFVAACGAGESVGPGIEGVPLFVPDQGYAAIRPEHWALTMQRGLAQLSPGNGSKHTIVVRSNLKPNELVEGSATSKEQVVATTATALHALPRAKVGEAHVVAGGELPASRFDLTFVPTGLGRVYERADVVLVGAHRVFHVIYTAPSGEPIDEAALHVVVSSLHEEG